MSSNKRETVSFDMRQFDRLMKKVPQIVEEETVEFMTEIAREGEVAARFALSNAVTDTGRSRIGRGIGVTAGRHKTGRMVNRLRSMPVKVKNGKVAGSIGWYYANRYFIAQERGTGDYDTSGLKYSPQFDYDTAYGRIAGKKPKGGIMGAHSLWAGRKKMEQLIESGKNQLKRRIYRRARGA